MPSRAAKVTAFACAKDTNSSRTPAMAAGFSLGLGMAARAGPLAARWLGPRHAARRKGAAINVRVMVVMRLMMVVVMMMLGRWWW